MTTAHAAALDDLLARHGQQHLSKHLRELDETERRRLAEQLRAIDLAALAQLAAAHAGSEDTMVEQARRAAPPRAMRLHDPSPPFSREQARAAGELALRQGRLGVVLVAGGQGTRLGFAHPKGMYPIGAVSNATLFQILLEKLAAVRRRYGAAIPLYLMTSPATHDETVDWLAGRRYFGLPADDVRIFCQGTMPAVDAATGRLLLEQRDRLALSPDGHGGLLAALARSSNLADARRRCVEQLFYLQVDNPLVRVCDPEFVGCHLLSRSELSTQVVAKRAPLDRVGNVISIDGRAGIIEYSDLPDDVAAQTNADGSLRLWAGNIAVHVFDLEFLERMSRDETSLPFHRALKKLAYLDDAGRSVEPDQPNAIKFERFIFDLLPRAENAIVVEVDAAETFAPVKNAPGAAQDSPETVRAQMTALHARWLEAAGARVAPGTAVEISPLFALDAEETAAKIKPGLLVNEPQYFC